MQGNEFAIARRNKTFRGPLAFVIAGVLAGALLIGLGDGGPASAAKASRGFTLTTRATSPSSCLPSRRSPSSCVSTPAAVSRPFMTLTLKGGVPLMGPW